MEAVSVIGAIADLVATLRRGIDLMPADTTPRAQWIAEAHSAINKVESPSGRHTL